MKSLYLIALALLALPLTSQAQEDEESVNLVGLKYLDYGSNLPDKLLTGKTAVIMRVDNAEHNNPARGDWKALARELQPAFADMDIDAVAYFYYDDLFCQGTIRRQQAQILMDRQVENLILFSRLNLVIRGKNKTMYGVVITPFSGDEEVIYHGQMAWRDLDSDLDKLVKKLTKTVNKSGLENTNNLVNTTPEFFNLEGSLVTNDLERTYPAVAMSQVKIALAPPLPYDLPADRPGGLANKAVEKQLTEENERRRSMAQQLTDAFASWPAETVTLDYDPWENEDQLEQEGARYVVEVVRTANHSIRSFMGLSTGDPTDDITTIIQKNGTTFRSIPGNAPVYKFYVRDTRDYTLYSGETWDADEGFGDALDHFMFYLRKEL